MSFMATQPSDPAPEGQTSPATMNDTREYRVENMPNWSGSILVLAVPFSLLLAVGIASGFGGSAVAFIVSIAAVVGLLIFLYRYLLQKIQVTVGQGSIR